MCALKWKEGTHQDDGAGAAISVVVNGGVMIDVAQLLQTCLTRICCRKTAQRCADLLHLAHNTAHLSQGPYSNNFSSLSTKSMSSYVAVFREQNWLAILCSRHMT